MLYLLTIFVGFCFGQAKPLPAEKPLKPMVEVAVHGHYLHPQQLEATDDRIRGLKVPDGFRITKFAGGLGKPRIFATHPDGSVYVTRREPGDCLLIRDVDNNGQADEIKIVAQKQDLHGIAVDLDRVYLATIKEVFVAERNRDGTLGVLKPFATLPDGGQHPNRTMAIGPDSMLYVSIGSTCNACNEPNPEHATILRFKPDGSREIFATGLRNTIGFGWHPETKEMWGMDHNIDFLGDNEHGEELNRLVEHARYGWPWIYESGKFSPHPDPPAGLTREELAKASRAPALVYTPHAAPMQMVFYTGAQFPERYRNSAFVAMRGSWNRLPPSGYEVVRIKFEQGKPVAFESFLTGFVSYESGRWSQFGRPVGLAVMKDGSLLVGDDTNGVIYQVSFAPNTTMRRP